MASTKPTNLDKLIDKIIFLKDYHDQYYIEKYNTNWILTRIADNEEIKIIEQKFDELNHKSVDLIDFVRILLSIIDHSEDQTLYIVMGAIDLFKEICESFNVQNSISSVDLVNYIVEVFLQLTPNSDILQTRKIPEQRKFDTNPKRVREIDINAPIIIGNLSSAIRRLIKNKIITDSYHHNNNGITRACYANEIKKIFTLDSLSGIISQYNLNCVREKIIKPKMSQDKREIIILDFAWSNRQNRLGCCLKDFSLCFWDANDDFDFEKNFNIGNLVNDFQTNIWYIEFLNIWVSTDKSHSIHGWDIEKETKQYSLTSSKIKQNILDIVGIDYLKLVAVSSMDRAVTIWDFAKGSVVLFIDLKKSGIHSLVFSKTYQTLITAGYENTISLWGINPTFLDQSLIGRLIGHSSMVTAVQVVEKSPMIISADDSGDIKVWDIRTMNCVQTIELGNKTMITKLIDISEWNKLCFVGTRVNFLEYDVSYNDSKNVLKNTDPLWPIRVDYNFINKELIVCTRRDIRYIHVETGRIKKIIVGLLENDDDDITKFRLVQQNKKFIIGDHRGNLGLYLYATGEKIKNLCGHTHEITNLKVDYINKLIVTSSWDSTIFIQKEDKNSSQIKRKIMNAHYGKEIVLLELSVYHNIMVTTTSNNVLYIWDYEFGKLISSISLEEGSEPTYIQFLNGYSVIIIADNIGKIHFIQFSIKDTTHIKMRKIGYLNVNELHQTLAKSGNVKDTFLTDEHNQQSKNFNTITFATRMLVDINYNELEPQTKRPVFSKLYISTNKGEVRAYDLMSFFKENYLEFSAHANTRSNYNAERQCTENFEKAILNLKIYNFEINKQEDLKKSISSEHNKSLSIFNKINSIDREATSDIWNNKIYEEINISKYLNISFQAHKDSLTTLSLMLSPENRLLTSSLDGYIKIWDLEGALLGSYNINHPLPMVWNLKIECANKSKKRILYGIKVIETLLRRYQTMLSLKEERRININKFLMDLEKDDKIDRKLSKLYGNNSRLNTPESISSNTFDKKKVLLMRDEYSPRDLQYEKVKKIYQQELQGPNLKQMENTKRLIMAQKMWKESDHKDKESDYLHEDTKEKNTNFMNYLLGDQKITFNDEGKAHTGLILDLSKKLDQTNKKKEKDKPKQGGAGNVVLEKDKPMIQLKTLPKSNSIKLGSSIIKASPQNLAPVNASTNLRSRRDSITSSLSEEMDILISKQMQKSKYYQNMDEGINNTNRSINENLETKTKTKTKIDKKLRFSTNPDISKILKISTKSPTRTDLKKTDFIFEYASQRISDYIITSPDDLKHSKISRSNTENVLSTKESNDFDISRRSHNQGMLDRRDYHNELTKLIGVLNNKLKHSIKGNSSSPYGNQSIISLRKEDILDSLKTENSSSDIKFQLPKLKSPSEKVVQFTPKVSYKNIGSNMILKEEDEREQVELPKINFKEEINKLRNMLKNTKFESIDKEMAEENPKARKDIQVIARTDLDTDGIDGYFQLAKPTNLVAQSLELDLVNAGILPNIARVSNLDEVKNKLPQFKINNQRMH